MYHGGRGFPGVAMQVSQAGFLAGEVAQPGERQKIHHRQGRGGNGVCNCLTKPPDSLRMARSIRIQAAGAYDSVMARGQSPGNHLHDDDDRRFFLHTLS